mgnify:CR=1 FL=1|tara:strand:- start:5599 stop:5775 length:177 start_codon:yes stop_codon:yes gene_type:complete
MPTKNKSRKRDEDGKFIAKPQEPVVKPVVKEPVVVKETSVETNSKDVITRHGSTLHTS